MPAVCHSLVVLLDLPVVCHSLMVASLLRGGSAGGSREERYPTPGGRRRHTAVARFADYPAMHCSFDSSFSRLSSCGGGGGPSLRQEAFTSSQPSRQQVGRLLEVAQEHRCPTHTPIHSGTTPRETHHLKTTPTAQRHHLALVVMK